MAVNNWINYAAIAPQKSPLQDLFANVLRGYKMQREPAKMEQEQKQREYDNMIKAVQAQFAEPEAQAKLRLLGAQAASAGGAAGLSKAKADLLSSVFGNQGSSQSGNDYSQDYNMPDQGGYEAAPQDDFEQQAAAQQSERDALVNNPPSSNPNSVPESNYETTGITPRPRRDVAGPSASYAKQAIASALMGFGQPKIVDVDGKKIAITPFGTSVVAEGMGPLQKELAKQDAKQVGEWESAYSSAVNKDSVYGQLADTISNPAFDSLRPYDWAEGQDFEYLKRFGTDEQKKLLGNFDTLSGDIIKSSSRDFAGAFRGGEQELLKSMKPNSTDTIGVIRGKMESLMLMNQLLMERTSLASSLVRTGKYTPSQAMQKAKNAIDGNAIKKKVQLKIEGKTLIKTEDGRIVAVPGSQADRLLEENKGASRYGA